MKALPHLPMYVVQSTPLVTQDTSFPDMYSSAVHNIEFCRENREGHWSVISLWVWMEIGYLLFC